MTEKRRTSPRVAFRVDASIQIGTGHVMRCLTLADTLHESGVECVFVSRAHTGHLHEMIIARGHKLAALPAPVIAASATPGESPAHAHWLGTDWAADVEETKEALDGETADWLVVDHYALDVRWERALRPCCKRLMVIDDLADRAHDCDLLLDQNLGRAQAEYLELVPSGCTLLTGPDYALLRPEFAALRQQSLARRRTAGLEHLLVTMGGVDKDNATGKVLEAVCTCGHVLPSNLRISVIMGPHAPWLDHVRASAERLPWPTEVAVGVRDMARRMAAADLAIGAAGSTSWERCCLGLPTLQVVLAGNQNAIANALSEAGAALTADEETLAGMMSNLFSDRNTAERIGRMSRAASDVTDGRGTQLVATKLMEV